MRVKSCLTNRNGNQLLKRVKLLEVPYTKTLINTDQLKV